MREGVTGEAGEEKGPRDQVKALATERRRELLILQGSTEGLESQWIIVHIF